MSRHHRRRWLPAALTGALAIAIAACTDDDPTGLSRADMDRVTLGTVPIRSDPADLAAPPGTPDPQMQRVLNQIAAANPSRPTVSGGATIHRAGVLQIEPGVAADFDADDLRSGLAAPLGLQLVVGSRLRLDADVDAVVSQA